MPGLVILLALGLAVFAAWVIGATAWSLTHPQRRTYAWAVSRNRPGDPGELNPSRPFESWTFRGVRHELPAWELVGDDPNGPTIVITHGWNESRVLMLPIAAALVEIASRVIIWDLPGHGEAPGISRLGADEHQDLLALIDRLGTDVILYGRSLGAGVSIRATVTPVLAADRVVGVLAEAPYNVPPTPARNVMRLMGMPCTWNIRPTFLILGLLLAKRPSWGWFDRREEARGLTVPLTVIHPELDAICPVEDGRSIAQAGGGRFVRIDGAGHNGLWTDDAFAPRMRDAAFDAVRAMKTKTDAAIPSAPTTHPRPKMST